MKCSVQVVPAVIILFQYPRFDEFSQRKQLLGFADHEMAVINL